MQDPKRLPHQIEQLSILLLIYCAASLFHFAHNAIYLADYPNMSPTLTSFKVIAAWLAITGIGIMGYLLLRRHLPLPALILFAIYSALGLDGLGHYTLAPISAHTFTMNVSIWLEVGTAMIALVWVVRLMVGQIQGLKTTSLP